MKTGTAEVLDDDETARFSDPHAGVGALGTERGNLPLESIDVRSTVAGLAVRTELAQGFHNPYDVPLEATYIFPLPDRAAVTRLRMEADDRVIEGVIKEREQARADYDQALSEGKRASIAEEERPGVFTMRVGNILPGERIVIRTTLTGRLPFEDGEATYRFPLVVAPRYIPGRRCPAIRWAAARPSTPTRCRTPRGSARRSCSPASRTRSGLGLGRDRSGRAAAGRRPVQPARPRRHRARRRGGFGPRRRPAGSRRARRPGLHPAAALRRRGLGVHVAGRPSRRRR